MGGKKEAGKSSAGMNIKSIMTNHRRLRRAMMDSAETQYEHIETRLSSYINALKAHQELIDSLKS
jgi:hypothetical protein